MAGYWEATLPGEIPTGTDKVIPKLWRKARLTSKAMNYAPSSSDGLILRNLPSSTYSGESLDGPRLTPKRFLEAG